MTDLSDIAHQPVLEPDGEVAVAHHGRHVFDRAVLGLPFGKAAVEYGHVAGHSLMRIWRPPLTSLVDQVKR